MKNLLFINKGIKTLTILGWLSTGWGLDGALAQTPTVESKKTSGNTELDLGREYLRTGDYEKAKSVFQKISRDKDHLPAVYQPYLQSLVQTKDWSEADKFLKRLIRSDETNSLYHAAAGRVAMQQGKAEEAEKQFQEAISRARRSEESTSQLAGSFAESDQPDWAIKTFLASRAESRDENRYALSLARLYRATGQSEAMIGEYLRFGKIDGNRELAQGRMQDEIKDEKEIILLEKVLYKKVQEQPNEPYFVEMLIWHLLQEKEFNKAFIQARAMDRRYRQEGQRIVEIGFMSMQNKDYPAAGKSFEYLVREYPKSANYPVYRRLLINAKEEVVKTTYPVNQHDIRVLIGEYQKLFDELGKNQKTLEALRNTARLYAFYLNEKDTATAILDLAIKLGGNDRDFIDNCKLELGDVYLLKGESWEATLLYSQVEKSEKDSPLGYEAKLRNAKLNYYKGDFELAKEMLDILKLATTREIANDALDLSLLIQDNTGVDSNETALKAYASVELLLFQNRTNDALVRLDSLFTKFKKDPLADEILFLRANTLLKENESQRAIEDLEKIVKDYPYDILSDDAVFLIAKTYQEKMNEKEKAMNLYQEILKKYPGSIYGAEARKRFRLLRGDAIN
ncbi:MAG: tetratricopeptide repeat protein [Cytophagaceae bacterium]|nr:tetratricopeptide repeat protein [Cytophagaceae bacterium]